MAPKKILITVKTYPSISVDHSDEIVCTAGIDEDGNWIRIYPIPFRKLDFSQQYQKYQWIEIDIIKNTSDIRPETYRPVDIDKDDVIVFKEKIGTDNNWYKRKKTLLNNVYNDIEKLNCDAHSRDKLTSLAIFKPTKILDFKISPASKEWNNKQKAVLQQHRLFEYKKSTEVVRKLPFKFSYSFSDSKGKICTMMNEDWEVGALYWKQLEKHRGDEVKACEDVRKKYLDEFVSTKELYFFLGTTKLHHFKPDPFIIVGVFYPKKEQQLKLDF